MSLVVFDKTKSRKGKQSVAQMVKMEVARTLRANSEVKTYVTYGSNISLATVTSVPPNTNLFPQIPQGNTNGTRIGNSIRVISAKARYVISLMPYNAISNPQSAGVQVRLATLSSKVINTNALGSTNVASDLFDVGSTNVGPQGNLLDSTLSFNRDSFVVHNDIQFELGSTYGSATGAYSTGMAFDNNRMSKYVEIDLPSAFRGKVVSFNDASNIASNLNGWVVCFANYRDGSATAGYTPIKWTVTYTLEYTDA